MLPLLFFRDFDPTPPLSSTKTSVWHWELDGEPTTVMLSMDTMCM